MRTVLCLSLLLLLTGCTHTVTEAQLYRQADIARGDTMGQTYYLGRSRGYDYFKFYWNVGSTRFRVAVPNGIIDSPQALGASPRNMYIHRGGLTPVGYDPDNFFVNPDPLANPDFAAESDPSFMPDYFIDPFAKPREVGDAVVPGGR